MNFRINSFDDLLDGFYDIIIAVESIKHSVNLDSTLHVLLNALKPDGQLIIVEDFYHIDDLSSSAQKYIRDWALVDAFRESDYLSILDPKCIQWSDLTLYMPSKSKFTIYIRLILFTIGSWFKGSTSLNIFQIFRGGFYLDLLYASKKMSYKILHYQKP